MAGDPAPARQGLCTRIYCLCHERRLFFIPLICAILSFVGILATAIPKSQASSTATASYTKLSDAFTASLTVCIVSVILTVVCYYIHRGNYTESQSAGQRQASNLSGNNQQTRATDNCMVPAVNTYPQNPGWNEPQGVPRSHHAESSSRNGRPPDPGPLPATRKSPEGGTDAQQGQDDGPWGGLEDNNPMAGHESHHTYENAYAPVPPSPTKSPTPAAAPSPTKPEAETTRERDFQWGSHSPFVDIDLKSSPPSAAPPTGNQGERSLVPPPPTKPASDSPQKADDDDPAEAPENPDEGQEVSEW